MPESTEGVSDDGVIRNKDRDSRDDENAVKHTDCRRKSRSCKGFRRDMSEWCSNKVVAVQDIAAVCRSHC